MLDGLDVYCVASGSVVAFLVRDFVVFVPLAAVVVCLVLVVLLASVVFVLCCNGHSGSCGCDFCIFG